MSRERRRLYGMRVRSIKHCALIAEHFHLYSFSWVFGDTEAFQWLELSPGSSQLHSLSLDLLCDLRGVTSSRWASVSRAKNILGECLEGKITVCDRECWRGKPQIQVLWFCFCFEMICNNRNPQPLHLAWIRNSEVYSPVQTKLLLKTEGRWH